VLKEIAKYHHEWLKIATYYTNDHAEDIVQEMYLRVADVDPDRIFQDGKLKKNFIYTVIRNLCLDYHRAKDRVIKVDFLEDTEATEICTQSEEQHQQHLEICEKLRQEHFYYETLYLIYTSSDNPSYRDISEKTGISLMTIYSDMKKIKQIIKDNE